jgi:hypothetical protein
LTQLLLMLLYGLQDRHEQDKLRVC